MLNVSKRIVAILLSIFLSLSGIVLPVYAEEDEAPLENTEPNDTETISEINDNNTDQYEVGLTQEETEIETHNWMANAEDIPENLVLHR